MILLLPIIFRRRRVVGLAVKAAFDKLSLCSFPFSWVYIWQLHVCDNGWRVESSRELSVIVTIYSFFGAESIPSA